MDVLVSLILKVGLEITTVIVLQLLNVGLPWDSVKYVPCLLSTSTEICLKLNVFQRLYRTGNLRANPGHFLVHRRKYTRLQSVISSFFSTLLFWTSLVKGVEAYLPPLHFHGNPTILVALFFQNIFRKLLFFSNL